jgi:hypothetical protein
MKVALLVALGICLAVLRRLSAQEFSSEIDLLYPEYAHPIEDAKAAIARHDFRFIAVDHARKIVPGMEHEVALRRRYGVKFLRQRLRLFATASENFSFNLRAHAYAKEYNLYLAHYLLQLPVK